MGEKLLLGSVSVVLRVIVNKWLINGVLRPAGKLFFFRSPVHSLVSSTIHPLSRVTRNMLQHFCVNWVNIQYCVIIFLSFMKLLRVTRESVFPFHWERLNLLSLLGYYHISLITASVVLLNILLLWNWLLYAIVPVSNSFHFAEAESCG